MPGFTYTFDCPQDCFDLIYLGVHVVVDKKSTLYQGHRN